MNIWAHTFHEKLKMRIYSQHNLLDQIEQNAYPTS